jgi:uncharacterized protein (DUF427 family)
MGQFTLETVTDSLKVVFNGEIILECQTSLLMHETGHDPVHYFSRTDAVMNYFQPTDHSSH